MTTCTALGHDRSLVKENCTDEMRPHLRQAYQNSHLFTQLQHELSAAGRALEELGRGVCCVLPSGKLAWATTSARHLLLCYGLAHRRKPEEINEKLKSWVKQLQAS